MILRSGLIASLVASISSRIGLVHGETSFSSPSSSGNLSNLGAILLESTGVGTSGVSSASGTA